MIERLLDSDSPDTTACKCGSEMTLSRTEIRGPDTLLKIFRCSSCRTELRLMVWSEESVDSAL